MDTVREELRKDKIQLWNPPYIPQETNQVAFAALADQYTSRLGLEATVVLSCLRELQLHALTKLEAKTRITLEGRVLGRAADANSPKAITKAFQTSDLGSAVRSALCAEVGLPILKVVAGGKSLQDDATLLVQGWISDSERKGKPLRVLLIAGASFANSNSDAADGRATSSQAASKVAIDPVMQIRDASARLTRDGFGDFELTDATTGRLVPVAPLARQDLIAAIVLHAKGREVLHGGAESAGRALPFLIESDAAFERCRSAGAAQLVAQLDNFGHLQLDICWAYALLGDSDHLPDAERRLALAEAAIVKKFDRNFLALAEIQAEQGRTLTPEVVPLVRLWLLRGIAQQCRGDPGLGRADLERAALFVAALRVDEAAVHNLLMLGATRVQAIAALRRAQGHADKAAADWLDGEKQRAAARAEREEQRKLGHTVDGSFLDLRLLAQLEGTGVDRKLAAAALRQANNNLDAALEAIRTQPADLLLGKRLKTQQPPTNPPVDEIALASLLSMGFERCIAEKALHSSNGDLEEAIMLASDVAMSQPQASDTIEAQVEGTAAEDVVVEASVDETRVEKAETKTGLQENNEKAEDAGRDAAYEEARAVIERELGGSLRGADLDEELAGASLEEEDLLLQQVGVRLP